MKRKEYFLLALKNNLHLKLSWLISVFSITTGKQEKDLKPYEVLQTPTGFFFYDPEKQGLTQIENSPAHQPLFSFKQGIKLLPGEVPNLSKEIVTTYGNVIFNMCTLVYGFGSKVPYQEGLIALKKIESYIAERLTDVPPDGQPRDPTKLYCDEYIKYSDGVTFLTELNPIAVQGLTEKAVTPPPGVKELKAKLLEQYKDQLHDPLVIAKIYQELINIDKEYLKGDPSEDFLISPKLRNVVRRKLYLTQGAEPGLSNRNELDLVQNSLYEGWQSEKFATLNNISRAGSFDRGSETQLGGVSTKEILRATSNIRLVKGDCGSTITKDVLVSEDNYQGLVGLRIKKGTQFEPIKDEDEAKSYLGKIIQKRSPQYCKLEKTDFCEYCVGKRLSDTETGASMAATQIGGIFLGIFMSSMHAKELKIAKMDLASSFS